MSVEQKGYFFVLSGNLEEHEIRFGIIKELKNRNKQVPNINLNVVKNKDNCKLGYAYGWIDDDKLYNIMIGLNEDGTIREEMIDDPDWTPGEIDDNLDTLKSWGDLVEEECPKIKKILEPLFYLEDIKITPCMTEIDYKKQNIIFTKNAENWITEKLLHNYFDIYEKDKLVHRDKNKRFTYPIIKIQKNKENDLNFISITFSPLWKYTATFLINMVKKIRITNGKKEKLIFFSQTKRK